MLFYPKIIKILYNILEYSKNFGKSIKKKSIKENLIKLMKKKIQKNIFFVKEFPTFCEKFHERFFSLQNTQNFL